MPSAFGDYVLQALESFVKIRETDAECFQEKGWNQSKLASASSEHLSRATHPILTVLHSG